MADAKEVRKRSLRSSKAKAEPSPPQEKVSPKSKKNKTDKKQEELTPAEKKFGPLPSFTKQRLWSRSILILGLMIIVYFSQHRTEEIFADSSNVRGKALENKCSPEMQKNSCGGTKCGRLVTDVLLSGEEVHSLIDLCRRGFVSHPGISVMDLHKKVLKMEGLQRSLDRAFQPSDSMVFSTIKSKLIQLAETHFGTQPGKMRLAGPSFLTMYRPGGKESIQLSVHQKSFGYAYSAIVFMTQHERDVTGGRLIFLDSDKVNRTIVPAQGRVVMFSSGEENSFFVDPVTHGLSYFLTIGFTCDKGIPDPTF